MIIWAIYILLAYVVLFMEKKRISIPRYIRLTPTVISIVLGFVLSGWKSYRLVGLGYAIGLVFAYYFMFRRLSYIDSDTGFYNEKYIAVLKEEAGKSGIYEDIVIRFKTSGDKGKLAAILKSWEPEYSKTVVKKDGEFLIISQIKKKSLAERFISFVSENCEKEGIEIESSYEMIKI